MHRLLTTLGRGFKERADHAQRASAMWAGGFRQRNQDHAGVDA